MKVLGPYPLPIRSGGGEGKDPSITGGEEVAARVFLEGEGSTSSSFKEKVEE
jgi:hypothetical protein